MVSTLTYLVEEQFPPLLLPEVHPLDSDLPAPRRLWVVGAPAVRRDAHDPRGALSDLDKVLQLVAGVPGGNDHLDGGGISQLNS